MTKEKLVARIKMLLKTDADLSSLAYLRKKDLERLIIWIGNKKE
jgi:nitrogen fixation protein